MEPSKKVCYLVRSAFFHMVEVSREDYMRCLKSSRLLGIPYTIKVDLDTSSIYALNFVSLMIDFRRYTFKDLLK